MIVLAKDRFKKNSDTKNKRFEAIYKIVFEHFSQELISLFDLKKFERKYLKFCIRTKMKMFFYFNLLIMWLPYVLSINVYSFLHQTASLANIFFVAALPSNNVNIVPAFLCKWKFIFLEKQHTKFFPQEVTSKFCSTEIYSELQEERKGSFFFSFFLLGLLSYFSGICKALDVPFSIKAIGYFGCFSDVFSPDNRLSFAFSSSTKEQIRLP